MDTNNQEDNQVNHKDRYKKSSGSYFNCIGIIKQPLAYQSITADTAKETSDQYGPEQLPVQ